jgi:hypothetical protein
VRLFAAGIVSVVLSLFSTSLYSRAQSVPKGLDPTVQLYHATPSPVSDKPAYLTATWLTSMPPYFAFHA